MTKFIHLTNANPEYLNDHVLINVDHIVTVFPFKYTDQHTGLEMEITKVYCPPHGTWDVRESTIDVIARLNQLTGSV